MNQLGVDQLIVTADKENAVGSLDRLVLNFVFYGLE